MVSGAWRSGVSQLSSSKGIGWYSKRMGVLAEGPGLWAWKVTDNDSSTAIANLGSQAVMARTLRFGIHELKYCSASLQQFLLATNGKLRLHARCRCPWLSPAHIDTISAINHQPIPRRAYQAQVARAQ